AGSTKILAIDDRVLRMQETTTPQIYFLLPRLIHKGTSGATGGHISNYLFAISLSRLVNVHVVPIIHSEVSLQAKDERGLAISPSRLQSNSRIARLLERSFFFASRARRIIERKGRGPIIATGAAIPTALAISKRLGVPLVLV